MTSEAAQGAVVAPFSWPTPSWRPSAVCTWPIPSSAPSHCSPSCGSSSHLAAGNKEVREALAALKAEESKAPEAAAASPAAAPPSTSDESRAQPDVAISLACFGCGRLPSEMGDGREKHPVCPKCRELKIPTTYWCDVNCPGNPDAWKRHTPVHKAVRRLRETSEGGMVQQRAREIAEYQARLAAQSGDA